AQLLREHLADPFIVRKEEQFVADDGSADTRAKIVHLEWRDGGGIKRLRVEEAVTQVLVSGSVEIVAPALRDHADLPAGHAAYIGAVDRGAGLELRDRFQRELQARGLLHELVIETGGVHAVEAEIVVLLRESGEADRVLRA